MYPGRHRGLPLRDWEGTNENISSKFLFACDVQLSMVFVGIVLGKECFAGFDIRFIIGFGLVKCRVSLRIESPFLRYREFVMAALQFFRKRPVLRWMGAILPLAFLLGCVTTGGSIQANYSQVSQLHEGDRFFDNGQYKTALLKYTSYYYSPFPNKKHEDYALYKIGLCQFLGGQYHDAQKSVNTLIDIYPQFKYMTQAKDLLAQCDEKIGERKDELTKQWAVLQREIAEAQKLASEKPNDPQYQFELGDLYWRAGRYDDAIKQYEISANMDRSYLEKKTL